MISQKQIDVLKDFDGVGWITALKTGAIRNLVDGGHIQLGLFDERYCVERAAKVRVEKPGSFRSLAIFLAEEVGAAI